MSLKRKLATTVGMFCLTIALLMVGVWAVSSTQIEIGGTISFNATNVNAIVSGSIAGASGGEITPNQLVYSSENSPSPDDLNTWKNDLVFDKAGTDIVMTINVENTSDERALYVSIVDSIGTTVSTMDKILKQGANPYTAGSYVKVDTESTKSFTITFDITNRDVSTEVDYGYLVNLVDESEVDESLEATITTGANSTTYKKEDGETSAVHTFTTTSQAVSASTPATTDYTIANNSTTEAMVVEPNFVATEDAGVAAYEVAAQTTSANITSKVYFSFDEGRTFSVLVEKYITVPAGSSVVVRVQVEATIDTTYSAKLNIGLYTQASCPSDYTNSYTYSIVDGKGYKTAEGTTTAVAMAEDEYIIVTPETVQSVLDTTVLSNKVVIFSEGVYDNLYIRPGYNTETKAYNWKSGGVIDEANEVSLDTVRLAENINSKYAYHRVINNVTFAGTENAKFVGLIYLRSYSVLYNVEIEPYDAVREKTYTASAANGSHFEHMYVDGITFTDMKFTYENETDDLPGRILSQFSNSSQEGYDLLNNACVKNCSFIAYGDKENGYVWSDGKFTGGQSAVNQTVAVKYSMTNTTKTLIKNVKYINNYVEGYHLGLKASNFENYEVYGNTIKNTEHNAIAIQSETGYHFTGLVKVYNNTIDGTLATAKDKSKEIGERAIRVGVGVDTDIYIENNSFANCGQYAPGDTQAELLKATSLTNGSLYFLNNTYGGSAITDARYEKGTHSGIVITRAI